MPSRAAHVEESAVSGYGVEHQFAGLSPESRVAIEARLPARIGFAEEGVRQCRRDATLPLGLQNLALREFRIGDVDRSLRNGLRPRT